ncbi:MAG TPA: glucosaminidase domain-containing protein [Candidatus Nitrosotenuis sp.]|nr:glucosaminidase domain-containing protein [Candidatus Nitrosotenuis sp.]
MTLTREQRVKWIEAVAPAAQAAAAQFGFPASVAIAQAALESGWGESSLAAEAFNFFGIKALRASDPFVAKNTTEVLSEEELKGELKRRPWIKVISKKPAKNGKFVFVLSDRFRKFSNLAQAFAFLGRLYSGARYAPAMKAADDPEVFAVRVQECGYSTAPDYAVTLVRLIRDYDLTRFDAAMIKLDAHKQTNGGTR